MINITRSLKKTSTAGLLAAACVLPLCSPVLAGGMDEPWMLDDLKAQLESLNNRVGKLERTYVQKGTELLWVRLSGHVNRAAMWAGNGHESDFFNVDSDGSNTRFRIEAGKDFNQDVSVGTILEMGVVSNPIEGAEEDDNTIVTTTNAPITFRRESPNSFTVSGRKADLFFSSKTYGTLSLGKNLTASTTAGSTDLSGTDIITYANNGDLAAGLEFQKLRGSTHVRLFEVRDAFKNYDGPGRRDRVRYDSPTFYGFIFSAAAMDGTGFRKHGNWDAALRYAQEFNKIKLAAAVGYTRLERDTATKSSGVITGTRDNKDDAWFGSASILFPQGWNFTVSGSRFHEDHKTPITGALVLDRDVYKSWYAKLGYLFNWCQWGQTALAADYGQTKDFLLNSPDGYAAWKSGPSKARVIGAGVVQKIDAVATELYAGYHNYRVDGLLPNGGYDVNPKNINAGMVGARIKM